MLVSVSLSQTSSPSTPKTKAEIITLCERAKAEVVESRALIAEYIKTVEYYEDSLGKAEEVNLAGSQEIDLLKTELAQVRLALAKERDALVFKEKEAREYDKALAKMTKRKNFFKALTKGLTVTTVILAAVAATVILKE